MARAPDPRIEQAKAMYLEGKKTSVTKVLGVKEAKEIIKKAMTHFDQEIANKNK